MCNLTKNILVFLALFLLSNASLAFILNNNEYDSFISISDIHFDPFYGCTISKKPCQIIVELRAANSKDFKKIFEKYNTDKNLDGLKTTNYNLLNLTMNELKDISNKSNPKFVLVLGDMLAHQFKEQYRRFSKDSTQTGYENFVKKIMEFLTLELNNTFPNTNVYSAVGNHDTYSGNYNIVPNGRFMHDTAEIWSRLIKSPKQKKEFLESFKTAGYYAIELSDNSKLIVLNTVLFSPKKHNSTIGSFANKQLSWLKKQLQSSKAHNQKVLIAAHIPINLALDISIITPYKLLKRLWKQQYVDKFTKIINQYSDEVVAFLPGHVHVDLFQFSLPNIQDKYIPIVITPSVSPSLGSNPAIKEFLYNPKDFKLIEFNRFYLPINEPNPAWQNSTRFNAVLSQNCAGCYMQDIIKHLTFKNYIFDFITKYYSNFNIKDTEENENYAYIICILNSSDINEFKLCIYND